MYRKDLKRIRPEYCFLVNGLIGFTHKNPTGKPGLSRLMFAGLDKTLDAMKESGKEMRRAEYEEMYREEENRTAEDNTFLTAIIRKEMTGGTLTNDEKARYERIKKVRGIKLKSVEEELRREAEKEE
jgi:hypothetical protein